MAADWQQIVWGLGFGVSLLEGYFLLLRRLDMEKEKS